MSYSAARKPAQVGRGCATKQRGLGVPKNDDRDSVFIEKGKRDLLIDQIKGLRSLVESSPDDEDEQPGSVASMYSDHVRPIGEPD